MGDSVRVWRAKRQYKLFEKIHTFVSETGYNPRQIPLKVLLPSLDWASVEEDEDLHTMWASLLANAANPQSDEVSPAFPDILRQLSTLDAKFLLHLSGMNRRVNGFHSVELSIYWNAVTSSIASASGDESDPLEKVRKRTRTLRLSLGNLLRLGLIEKSTKLDISLPDESRFPARSTYPVPRKATARSEEIFRVSSLGHELIRICTGQKQP